MTELGLCCCTQALCSCRDCSVVVVLGFSLPCLLSLQNMGFGVSRFQYLRWVSLGAPTACRILVPIPGIEPTSPALAGRLLTTGPPRKSSFHLLRIIKKIQARKRDTIKWLVLLAHICASHYACVGQLRFSFFFHLSFLTVCPFLSGTG